MLNKIEQTDKILMHDWLAAVLASCKGKIGFVDCPTMLYRQHGVNSVGAKKYGLALFVGKIKKAELKKSLIDTTIQAQEIVDIYGETLGQQEYQLIKQYSEIWRKNKFQRIQFYLKNKVLKKGVPRKVCQLIIG